VRKLDLFPKWIIRILGKFLWVKAGVNRKICVKCMLCQRACPAGAIEKDNKEYPNISKKKCIGCFCCHEMCPHKAVKFRKGLLAKIFIKEN
jgi:formate hydrogenlyase subunit 6/NADH:ubiquinone oxidoreductase subunit I